MNCISPLLNKGNPVGKAIKIISQELDSNSKANKKVNKWQAIDGEIIYNFYFGICAKSVAEKVAFAMSDVKIYYGSCTLQLVYWLIS